MPRVLAIKPDHFRFIELLETLCLYESTRATSALRRSVWLQSATSGRGLIVAFARQSALQGMFFDRYGFVENASTMRSSSNKRRSRAAMRATCSCTR